jgi:hypothetical protein
MVDAAMKCTVGSCARKAEPGLAVCMDCLWRILRGFHHIT